MQAGVEEKEEGRTYIAELRAGLSEGGGNQEKKRSLKLTAVV